MKYIAIMAGGVGSRFWPASTSDNPKQFLDILGVGKSLIRLTYERVLDICPAEQILIVTNARYKALVNEHIPEIPDANILCEPSMNNTAPSVAYTALHLNAIDKDAVFAMLPSDHVILKEKAYISLLEEAFEKATNSESIITLGISPTRPDTGYGYIEMGEKENNTDFRKVNQFKEKPSKDIAQKYLDAGNFLWNAGMFVWSTKTVLKAFEECSPNILKVLKTDESQFGTNNEQSYINECYPKTESISVDYALLERYHSIYTLPADIGWSDLGTWNSLHQYVDKDENDCAVLGDNTRLIKTTNSIIRSASDKTLVIKGLDNYIVVDEPGALLIFPKADEQEIKQVVKSLDQ